jgi:hypothetical protein
MRISIRHMPIRMAIQLPFTSIPATDIVIIGTAITVIIAAAITTATGTETASAGTTGTIAGGKRRSNNRGRGDQSSVIFYRGSRE